MIDVPAHVDDEAAYIAGAMARIARNAWKTTVRRMESDAEFASVIRAIRDRAERGTKFFISLSDQLDKRGKLSDKQLDVVRGIIARDAERLAEIKKRDASSEHIGIVGKRDTFVLTVTGYAERETMYGTQYIYFFKDAAGNVVIWKASNPINCAKGDTVTIVASVKSHGERDGVKQTYITRGKIKANGII